LLAVPPEEGKSRFADFDIEKKILAALQDLEFSYCTPIQAQGLPLALAGKDVAGKAQTGTGKTAAFLIAAYNHLLRHPLPHRQPGSARMLVLAPTRELAVQIFKDAEDIGKYCGANNLVVFGGMGHKKQQEELQNPIDILVGTPGRLLDYLGSRHLQLGEVEILVVDEADRMLDMGFIPDVRRIVSRMPAAGKRQTMFFSATLTPEILRLVDRWLVNPVMIEAEQQQLVTDLIDQCFYTVTTREKLAVLLSVLRQDNATRMLIFVNRRDHSLRLQDQLADYGVSCAILSGDVPQKKRLQILEGFRAGKIPVVVATDVAARGIHVENISHVVNYDLPDQPEDYVHRIGRTGRAGETGKSISFICEYGAFVIPELEKLLGYEIKCLQPPENWLVLPPRLPRPEGSPARGADYHGQNRRRERSDNRGRRPDSGRRRRR
jgi:ATP-dependent RNA helicase RhlB